MVLECNIIRYTGDVTGYVTCLRLQLTLSMDIHMVVSSTVVEM